MTSDPSVAWRERESRQTSQWTRQRALNRHWFSSPFNLPCQHRDWEKELFLFIKLPGLRHSVAVAQVDGYIPLLLLVVSLAFKDGIISLAPSHPFKSVQWWDYSCDDVMMERASRILRSCRKGRREVTTARRSSMGTQDAVQRSESLLSIPLQAYMWWDAQN